jgi:hypothetical protein
MAEIFLVVNSQIYVLVCRSSEAHTSRTPPTPPSGSTPPPIPTHARVVRTRAHPRLDTLSSRSSFCTASDSFFHTPGIHFLWGALMTTTRARDEVLGCPDLLVRVLSFAPTPADLGRCAVVSRAFRAASEQAGVGWVRKSLLFWQSEHLFSTRCISIESNTPGGREYPSGTYDYTSTVPGVSAQCIQPRLSSAFNIIIIQREPVLHFDVTPGDCSRRERRPRRRRRTMPAQWAPPAHADSP